MEERENRIEIDEILKNKDKYNFSLKYENKSKLN